MHSASVCLLSLALVATAGSIGAQSSAARYVAKDADVQLVRQAARDYLEGFYEGDTTKLVRSVAWWGATISISRKKMAAG